MNDGLIQLLVDKNQTESEDGFIYYKAGYKYQANVSVEIDTGIIPPEPISTEYAHLSLTGVMTIYKGFASDGPSGITIDTPSFMAGAFCHDALYEMLRLGLLPADQGYRKAADKLIRKHCRQNNMTAVRAWYVYHLLRVGGGPASTPEHQRKIMKAPAVGWRIVEDETI